MPDRRVDVSSSEGCVCRGWAVHLTEYIDRRRKTIGACISTDRSIFDLCRNGERRRGTSSRGWWWDQLRSSIVVSSFTLCLLYLLSVSPLKGTIYNLNDALEDQPHLWLWRERSDQLATAPKRRLDAAHTCWTIAVYLP